MARTVSAPFNFAKEEEKVIGYCVCGGGGVGAFRAGIKLSGRPEFTLYGWSSIRH